MANQDNSWDSSDYITHFSKWADAMQATFTALENAYDGLTISFSVTIDQDIKPKEPTNE